MAIEIILSIVIIILFVSLVIAIRYVFKFAKIIFVFEEEIGRFSNLLIDIGNRLEQVQQIRALMSHPSAATYIAESFEEIRFCNFLLVSMVRKSKMLLKRDYTELEIDGELTPLHKRLEQDGVYDPEEDGEINVMSLAEAKQVSDNALDVKNSLTKRLF